MPHPHLGFRFVEVDDWAVLDGPAHDRPADPHVLVLATADRVFLQGVLTGISARSDCVCVRYRLDPARGIHRAEARFASELGAGELAVHLKDRGFRLLLHPVVLDEAWWAPFRDNPIPAEQLWTLPLGEALSEPRFHVAPSWPWAEGPAYTEGGTSHLPRVKICVASWDRQRMDAVLTALAQHPRCFGVKSNHPLSQDTSFLGRAVFLDEQTTGWVTRHLQELCPDVVPVVQDDGWFKGFRKRRD